MNVQNSSFFSVHLPSNLKYIGNFAFYRCGISKIDIPPGVQVIGYGAFQESNISEIVISNTTIGERQFFGCEFLEKVTVISDVIEIGYAAFGECINLTEMVLPFVGSNYNDTPGLTSEQKLFGYIFGESIKEGLSEAIQQYDATHTVIYGIPSKLKKVTITNDTQISAGAFSGCDNIACIILPNGRTLKLRASTGIAWYPKDAVTFDELSRFSDFAMYKIKKTVKGSISEFNRNEYDED